MVKIRKGFVSNSSTSSFVLWGISLEREDYQKKFKVTDQWDVDEKLANGLESGTGLDGDYLAIGKDPRYMKGDQTLNQFKAEIVELLQKSGLTDITVDDIDLHEDSFYDG